MKIMQHIERALFGATAEEAVEMRLKLIDQHIDQRIEQRLSRMVEALEQDDDRTVPSEYHCWQCDTDFQPDTDEWPDKCIACGSPLWDRAI